MAKPPLEILPLAQLQAKGAYGEGTIYLAQEYLFENPPEAITEVLLEEIGHYLDEQLLGEDTRGDEGALFAAVVLGNPLAEAELAALKSESEDDQAWLSVGGQTIAVEQGSISIEADNILVTSHPGVFTVGQAGEISLDFLADAGSYRSELALFNLEGMEAFEPGSVAYIKEAARRALSNSELGYMVVKDRAEGARFSGELGESDKNAGEYVGSQTYSLTPGDQFAFLLVPQGTVESVLQNSRQSGNERPLFSVAAANPGGEDQLAQVMSGLFTWEDLRRDQESDADFNDLIIYLQGATGEAVPLEKVMAPQQEWRDTELGQELLAFVTDSLDQTPPVFDVALVEDTGADKTDKITQNPEITGTISDRS